jgi:hypothetical protein
MLSLGKWILEWIAPLGGGVVVAFLAFRAGFRVGVAVERKAAMTVMGHLIAELTRAGLSDRLKQAFEATGLKIKPDA